MTTDSKCHRKRVIGMTDNWMPTRYEYTSISCARSTPHYLKDGFFKSNGENIFFSFWWMSLNCMLDMYICLIVFKKGSELISQNKNKNSLEQSIN